MQGDRLVASGFDLVDVMRCGQGGLGSIITDQGGAVHDAPPRLDNSEKSQRAQWRRRRWLDKLSP
jgi:hypothetical protein